MRSVIAFAGLAASVVAESSSCPATTTLTATETYKSTVEVWVTTTPVKPLPTETETPTVYVTTGTVTETVPHFIYETACTESTIQNVEYTSTVYSGDFTSSSLRPSTSCAPKRSFVQEFPKGTTTGTYTHFVYASTVTAPTTTSQVEQTEYLTSGTTTETVEGYCTATVESTTGTATFTATQALKCAPTNLIGTDGLSYDRSGYRGVPSDGIAWYSQDAPHTPPGFDDRTGAHKDASACCQACQEDTKCSGSVFSYNKSNYPTPSPPWCKFYGNYQGSEGDETEACGLAFTVFKGDEQVAQSGRCGYIAENVWADGLCPEGMNPRECEHWGVGGLVN